MSLRRCFWGSHAVLSSSIIVLSMSGRGAAAALDTNSVLDVDKISEVDFWRISGARVDAVAVGMTSDCKVLFTAQDVFHFACGGASDARAKQNLATMIKADGVPEGFHCGLWKPVDGPREGGLGSWSVSLSTLKDFVKTQVLLARQSVAVGGAGVALSAARQQAATKHRPMPHAWLAVAAAARRAHPLDRAHPFSFLIIHIMPSRLPWGTNPQYKDRKTFVCARFF
jgi:hypothetical protein